MLITQLCLTLCNLKDCSLPDSPVHGILQARILEWVSFSRGSSRPRDSSRVSCTAGGSLPAEPPGKPVCVTLRDVCPADCWCSGLSLFLPFFSLHLFHSGWPWVVSSAVSSSFLIFFSVVAHLLLSFLEYFSSHVCFISAGSTWAVSGLSLLIFLLVWVASSCFFVNLHRMADVVNFT